MLSCWQGQGHLIWVYVVFQKLTLILEIRLTVSGCCVEKSVLKASLVVRYGPFMGVSSLAIFPPERDEEARLIFQRMSLKKTRRQISGYSAFFAPVFAALPASSFPLSPEWEGTHWYCTMVPLFSRTTIVFRIMSRVSPLESQYSLDITSKEDMESVKITTLLGGSAVAFSSWGVFWMAQSLLWGWY